MFWISSLLPDKVDLLMLVLKIKIEELRDYKLVLVNQNRGAKRLQSRTSKSK